MSEKYKLYKKHESEIFQMLCDILDNMPSEKDKQDEYLQNRNDEANNRLIEMGFIKPQIKE